MFNVTGLARGLSFGKIIGGLSRTLQIANQIIPLYQRAKPAIQNARSMISVLKEMGKKNVTSSSEEKTFLAPNKSLPSNPPLQEKKATAPTFFL